MQDFGSCNYVLRMDGDYTTLSRREALRMLRNSTAKRCLPNAAIVSSNPYEAKNRAHKARRLLETAKAVAAPTPFCAEMVQPLGQQWWNRVALLATALDPSDPVKPPSEETIAEVQRIAEAEQRRARVLEMRGPR